VPLDLVRSPRAKGDILDIWFYTADAWGSDQADQYVRMIDRSIERLVAHPKIGAPFLGCRVPLRSIKAESHRVFYQLIDQKIEIVRVLHSSVDAALQLSSEP
jgi:toxin ParE1/3/4